MRGWIASAVLLVGIFTSAHAEEALQPEWSSGFRVSTEDGAFSLGVNAMVLSDWSWYVAQDDANKAAFGNAQNGNEIRNARMGISGVMYGNVQYRIQYEFAAGTPSVTLAYMGITGIPGLGTVRMGHVLEPFSMTFPTSPTNLAFMERPLPWAMAPGWNTGILAFNTVMDKRVAWALSVSKQTGGTGKAADDDNIAVTGRLNGAAIGGDGGKKLVRLGLAYSHRKTEGVLRYAERPESHLFPVLPDSVPKTMIDTGPIATDRVNLVGGELVTVMGPFWLQAEGIASYADVPGDSDPLLGYYATAGYFLTGESRPYGSTGVPGRVTPSRNFGKDGFGAWELLVQYSALDFDGAGADAGVLTAISAGVNWYLNPKSRIMLNYVHGNHNTNGVVSTVQMRFSVDI